MIDYPSFCIARDGYAPEVDDGSRMDRAEDGTPRIQRFFSVEQKTFTVRHPLMSPADQTTLLAFYADNKSSYVRYVEPDTLDAYQVLMLGPPRPVDRARGLITYEMRMTGSLIV